jgi:hypothetical protein
MLIAAFAAPAFAQTDDTITITGTMTNEGVECAALRGDDGVLYTFRRSMQVRGFQAGDRVKLQGRVQQVSICQQGTTVAVTRVEKLP